MVMNVMGTLCFTKRELSDKKLPHQILSKGNDLKKQYYQE